MGGGGHALERCEEERWPFWHTAITDAGYPRQEMISWSPWLHSKRVVTRQLARGNGLDPGIMGFLLALMSCAVVQTRRYGGIQIEDLPLNECLSCHHQLKERGRRGRMGCEGDCSDGSGQLGEVISPLASFSGRDGSEY